MKVPAPPPGLAGGSEIAGNVIAGLGLGWLLEYFFPGVHPWGLAGGIVLGSVSGFYHLLKREGAFESFKPKPKDKDDAA